MSEPLFDLEPEPPAGAARLTERDMLDLLHKRFGILSYNGAAEAERYVRADHVRARAGFDCGEADFIAVDTWASAKLAIHGVEVKVSRSDWLRELKRPDKAAPFLAWCTHWWIAASHPGIVRDGELPESWGLLVARGKSPRLVAQRAAVRQTAHPIPAESIASLLRAVAKTTRQRAS